MSGVKSSMPGKLPFGLGFFFFWSCFIKLFCPSPPPPPHPQIFVDFVMGGLPEMQVGNSYDL